MSRVLRKGRGKQSFLPLTRGSEERCGGLNHEPVIRSKDLVGSSFGFPSFLLLFLARSISVAELRPHLAKARESLSIADGIAAVDDCSFQSSESFLDGFFEGFQILRHRSGNELSQGFDVGLNCCSLIMSKTSFKESGQQAGGYQVEGTKFLPELGRLLVSPGDFTGLH